MNHNITKEEELINKYNELCNNNELINLLHITLCKIAVERNETELDILVKRKEKYIRMIMFDHYYDYIAFVNITNEMKRHNINL